MSSKPIVSVIVPVSNGGACLERALCSIEQQSFNDLEIVAIDNGSTDGTAELLNSYHDSRLRRYSLKRQCRDAIVLNLGREVARGDFLAFLEMGDVWLPHKLQEQLDLFEQSVHVPGLIYAGVSSEIVDRHSVDDLHICRGDVYKALLQENFIYPSSVLLRRDVSEGVGAFDESLSWGAWYEYWLRIARETSVDCVEESLLSTEVDRQTPVSSRELHLYITAREVIAQRYMNSLIEYKLVGDYYKRSVSCYLALDEEDWDPTLAKRLLSEAYLHTPYRVKPYIQYLQLLLPTSLRQKLNPLTDVQMK